MILFFRLSLVSEDGVFCLYFPFTASFYGKIFLKQSADLIIHAFYRNYNYYNNDYYHLAKSFKFSLY